MRAGEKKKKRAMASEGNDRTCFCFTPLSMAVGRSVGRSLLFGLLEQCFSTSVLPSCCLLLLLLLPIAGGQAGHLVPCLVLVIVIVVRCWLLWLVEGLR